MFFLKLFSPIIYAIAILSHKGFAPITILDTSASTSTPAPIPPYLSHLKHPLDANDVYEEREKCKREIYAVFNPNQKPLEHAMNALLYLTRFDENLIDVEDQPSNYARMYYDSFEDHLAYIKELNVRAFCRIRFNKNTANNTKKAIISFFNGSSPKENLNRAFYYYNHADIYSTKKEYIIKYYELMIQKLGVVVATKRNKSAFLTTDEFCNSLIQKTEPILQLDLNEPQDAIDFNDSETE